MLRGPPYRSVVRHFSQVQVQNLKKKNRGQKLGLQSDAHVRLEQESNDVRLERIYPRTGVAAVDCLDPRSCVLIVGNQPSICAHPIRDIIASTGCLDLGFSCGMQRGRKGLEAFAVLEVLFALKLHGILKYVKAVPLLMQEVTLIHSLGRRRATNAAFLLYGSGIQRTNANQVFENPALEGLVAELLATGHDFVTSIASWQAG